MSESMAGALADLIAGRDLEGDRVEALFGRLMDGDLDDAQKAALLVALAAKGETPAEIAGAARAMRRRCIAIEHSCPDVVDTCGTGGDGRGSFNISTAAALVAAAAGARVAKHGNRSVSSRSGSADVLEALGVPLDLETSALARCLEEVGIAFLFAPALHPAMHQVVPIRRSLGIRTVFNLLGPLTNPAGARRQVIGVWSESWVEPIARVLLELGAVHALVVHGSGLDELTTTGRSYVAEVHDGAIESREISPRELGLAEVDPRALAGGDAQQNARRLEAMLAGGEPELADVTALNAAAALYVAGQAIDLAAGLERARDAIASGAARETLDRLRGFSP